MPKISRRQLKQLEIADPLEKDPYLLALLYLFSIGKDVVDSFQPYKSPWYIKRDFMQPIRGLSKLPQALYYATLMAPTLFLLSLGDFFERESPKTTFTRFSRNLYTSLGFFVLGLSLAFRGLTQIGATPLTWARIFLRLYLTHMMGWKKFQDSASVQALVAQGQQAIAEDKFHDQRFVAIEKRLLEKQQKAEERGIEVFSAAEVLQLKTCLQEISANEAMTSIYKEWKEDKQRFLAFFSAKLPITTATETRTPSPAGGRCPIGRMGE